MIANYYFLPSALLQKLFDVLIDTINNTSVVSLHQMWWYTHILNIIQEICIHLSRMLLWFHQYVDPRN